MDGCVLCGREVKVKSDGVKGRLFWLLISLRDTRILVVEEVRSVEVPKFGLKLMAFFGKNGD